MFDTDTKLLIWHEGSRGQLCLQAVDSIAWAVARKYEWGDTRAYAQIVDCIVSEEGIAEARSQPAVSTGRLGSVSLT